jgi:zinc transport system substrate-binding protein
MLKLIAGISLSFFLCVSCAFAQNNTGRLKVVTTLFPTYDFARQIGGDKVDVTLLLPPGVESHAFEPKPQDIVRIGKADIFIYTG